MPIRIPADDREDMGTLLRLPPTAIASIQSAIERCTLHSRRGDIADQLAEQLGPQNEYDPAGIAKVIVSLYFLRASQDMTAAEVAEEVIEALRESSDDRYGKLPTDWSVPLQNLTRLLSSDATLGLSAKAAFLSYQAPRHVSQARIITDARPVFPGDPSTGPAAFVITHTLQVEYHEDGSEKEWFIALDHDDLDTLANAVARARVKERTLRRSLTSASVPVVDVSGANDDEN